MGIYAEGWSLLAGKGGIGKINKRSLEFSLGIELGSFRVSFLLQEPSSKASHSSETINGNNVAKG